MLRDTATKLHILWSMLGHAYKEWVGLVWRSDLDAHFCCSGGSGSHDACGCGGATVRDVMAPRKRKARGGES